MNWNVALGICAYNEGIKLRWTVDRLRAFIENEKKQNVPRSYQLLITDDASTDGIPQELAQKGDIHLFRNEIREGVGGCMRRQLAYGLEHGFDVIVYLAGNNKDNPDQISRLLQPILEGEYDLIQGSRYLPGGETGNMPRYRQIATRWIHPLLFSLFSGQKMTDTTNGFRAIRLSLLKDHRIRIDQDWLNHYELEPYLLFKAIRLGHRVGEVPVSKIYPPKHLGYSKMKPITGWWSILKPILLLGFGIKQ